MNKSLLTNIFSILIIIAGYISPIASSELKTMGLYSFSGAITNWLAIHMLFEKVPFLYGSGIITERFEDFKIGIKELIMNQFFTQENLNKFLTGSLDSSSSLINSKDIISAINFDNVFLKLKSAILESPFGGMLGMFGGEQALDPLKPQFEAKFEEIIEEMLNDEKFISALIPNTDSSNDNSALLDQVQLIVTERLNELTPTMVKEIIQIMIKEHLGWLVVWGGVFGALIGLATTRI
jgi:uncharacterized membrane protein YheB (UPF0754 family)